jgi:hypothetical protein
MSLFDDIRDATARVTDAADDVHIDDDALGDYADTLIEEHADGDPEAWPAPRLDPDHHLLDAGDRTVAYLVLLETINFGSGYFPWVQPRDGLTGYSMVADALREYIETHGVPDPADLAELDTDSVARVFDQEIEHDSRRKLMTSFATAWRELGEHLVDEWDGSYVALVEAADGSAETFVDLLTDMSLFRDVVMYRNIEVPFYKRAQLAASDFYAAFDGQGPGGFDDIDELTTFADNRLPHVLRMDGILDYSEPLADHVDGRKFLRAGTAREIEIRASTIQAVEALVDALRDRGADVSAREVDNVLWHRGQQDRYRVRPAHLTQTVFY